MKSLLMRIIFVCCITLIHTHAFESTTPQTLSMLQKIDHEAIVFGNGSKSVYVFVDPNCPNSQDFITMIYESPKMKETYQYHIFLYELKRMNSSKIIESIYLSADPMHAMFDYMIGHKDLKLTAPNTKTLNKIHAIDSVAQELKINKRPYLIISKETR